MNKKELIQKLNEFPDDMEVKAHMSFDWGDENFDIDDIEYDEPFCGGQRCSDKKFISLRLY